MSATALLSYALTVPDAEAGKRFYSTFGLIPAERDNVTILRCEGRDQDQVFLVEGKRKQLHHLRFGADEAGLANIRARMPSAISQNCAHPPLRSPAACG
jgi:hypothetical protein